MIATATLQDLTIIVSGWRVLLLSPLLCKKGCGEVEAGKPERDFSPFRLPQIYPPEITFVNNAKPFCHTESAIFFKWLYLPVHLTLPQNNKWNDCQDFLSPAYRKQSRLKQVQDLHRN